MSLLSKTGQEEMQSWGPEKLWVGGADPKQDLSRGLNHHLRDNSSNSRDGLAGVSANILLNLSVRLDKVPIFASCAWLPCDRSRLHGVVLV